MTGGPIALEGTELTMDTKETTQAPIAAAFWRGYAVVVFVAGLALRVNYQVTHHLWNDEAGIFRGVEVPWSEFWYWLTTYEIHPPLFHLFLRAVDLGTFGLLSPDEVKYSVLVWFVAIGGTFWWYVGLPLRTSVGISLAFGVVSLGPVTAYLGAEVRPYSLLTALFFAAVVMLDVWLQELQRGEERRSRLVAIAVLAPLMAWTHYAGFLICGALLVGGLCGAFVVTRRVHRRFATAWLLGMLGTLPVVFILLPFQMGLVAQRVVDPLRLRPSDTVKFVHWAIGPTTVVFVVGIVLLVILRRGIGSLSYREPSIVAFGALAVSFVAAAYVVGFSTGGVNLANLGVVPVLVILLAVVLGGLIERASGGFLAVLGVTSVILTAPMTMLVLDAPANLSGNRVSPVDVLIDFEERTGMFNSSQGSFAVMLIDNSVMNNYFMQQARELFPGLDIRTMSMRGGEGLQQNGRDLAAFLAEQSERGTVRALVITRGSFDHRVKPFLEFSWYRFEVTATVVNLQR